MNIINIIVQWERVERRKIGKSEKEIYILTN
jgi:hypothetical protein